MVPLRTHNIHFILIKKHFKRFYRILKYNLHVQVHFWYTQIQQILSMEGIMSRSLKKYFGQNHRAFYAFNQTTAINMKF